MTDVPVIQIHQLTKQFDDHIAVDQLSLEVYAGEVYGLIGPNGAGKTTLIRLLSMADSPTAGEIIIDGQKMARNEANAAIKRRIGFLPDDFPLYDDLSVNDYLEYFGQLYYLEPEPLNQRVSEVLALVNLEHKRSSLISTLSRGMKQRLSLARTVIHRPRLLLLDEPVSGLDPIARIDYCKTIKRLQSEGITILISSHILSDLEDFCTTIGIMEQGRLVESGRLQSLYRREGQQLLIAVLEPDSRLEIFLEEHPLVTAQNEWVELAGGGRKLGVTFTGSEADAAELLRVLILEGIRVSEFHYTQETLEDIFVRLGYQQTS
ncbi:MAG: ABC-2 type transport system ATP-binding protein [Phormidesmis priestleyi Ana]|uniref:ABC-2 type transport system ATP-binding protein n=1 Tax=Phormidesmis priestleyi Ana TaxID=1666911 RepID=A0A0P8C5F8_9CYAN|nr:MAG: ABC-2 type transport system ATP-binding protein [Phormidesmis priestleyi Ana]